MTIGISMLATIAVFAIFYFLKAVVLPIILSYLLYVLIDPLASWAERKKISRNWSSSVLVLLVVAISGLIGLGGYTTFAQLGEQIPQYSEKIKNSISSVQAKIAKLEAGGNTFVPKAETKENIQKVEVVEKMGKSLTSALLHGIDSLFEGLTICLFIPMLALFFLLDKPYLLKQLRNALEPRVSLDLVGKEISEMVRSFFLGNLVVGLVTAIGFYIIFLILKLNNGLALALFAGFVNLIPVIGSILGGLLPALQTFMQFSSPVPTLIVMGGSIFLHFFIANFIMPKVVGSRINVNASAATMGLIFWGWLWGPVGLLLAIPFTALVRIFLSTKPSLQPWADLLSEKKSRKR
jgi:predicted PurR-regulated permease PerM